MKIMTAQFVPYVWSPDEKDNCKTGTVVVILKEKGCEKLVLQIGQGKFPVFRDGYGISIETFRMKEKIDNEIMNADLIIGHAGAGTCLQTLQAGKRLLVVVNEDLMGNHQTELAEKLSEEGYLQMSFCSQVKEFLESDSYLMNLKPFPDGQTKKIIEFIDQLMGFG